MSVSLCSRSGGRMETHSGFDPAQQSVPVGNYAFIAVDL